MDVALRRQILGVVPGKSVRFECVVDVGVVSGRTEVRGVGGRRTSSYGTETLTLRTQTGEEWSSSSASGLLGSPPGEVVDRLRAFVADGSEQTLTLWWAPWLENLVGIPFALVAALALLALLRVAFGKATASPSSGSRMMLGLRWTLGIITGLVAGGWVALAVLGSGFRSSFGGSENPPWMIALQMVVGGLVIASLLWPETRALLHLVAAIMLLLAVGSLILARETVFVATPGLLYAGAWLWFYYRSLRL